MAIPGLVEHYTTSYSNTVLGVTRPLQSSFSFPIMDEGGGEIRPGTPIDDPSVYKYDESRVKSFLEEYAGQTTVPLNPAEYGFGNYVVSSGDFVGNQPGPMMQAVIDGKLTTFVGKTAVEDCKSLILEKGQGELYTDDLYIMLTPTTIYIGNNNCVPCDPSCCIKYCYFPDPEITIPYRKHKRYYRFYVFTTFIYDINDDQPRRYESINSNVVVVRSNYSSEPFDVAYIPPGVTAVRFWAKIQEIICTPDDTPPCPASCGTEVFLGGDSEFYLYNEVKVPKEHYRPSPWSV